MRENGTTVGIDLGTTNSEIAAYVGGQVRILGCGRASMLPSCVGLSPTGELLVGEAARNQQLVYPERTIRSVKRQMGSSETLAVGEKRFTPPEVSALILRELVEWAKDHVDGPVRKAVITVPAYFSDAQRTATREAGALAGLEVVRIVNEPTAASLAYGFGSEGRQTVMIYDLGGGTFDVSIVTLENEVTEVLSSHGNNQLGGDDFNDLLLERLLETFRNEEGIDLRDSHPLAYARLWWAAEQAKRRLSTESHVKIREEALIAVDGTPVHLELEISRREYEELIRPLVESTLESVARAMGDAETRAGDLDAVLLVGGSTRTPLIAEVLEECTGRTPRQDVHPDLCVALGAGVLAGRLSGEGVERVLVDVSPYSFGPSYLGDIDGTPYPHCYRPLIRRNTPLPVTRTETYYTVYPRQTTVEVNVFQGEDRDALKNIPVGQFVVDGLTPTEEPNEVLCRMSLDLDGILQVTATEKRTGKSTHITIRNALRERSVEELSAARQRLEELFDSRHAGDDEIEGRDNDDVDAFAEIAERRRLGDESPADRVETPVLATAPEGDGEPLAARARSVVERARSLYTAMHDEDREEAIALNEMIETALAAQDRQAAEQALAELKELLFFVEGK